MANYPISTESIKPTLSLIGTLFIMLGLFIFSKFRDIFGLYCLVSGIAVYLVKIFTYHYMGGDSEDEQG